MGVVGTILYIRDSLRGSTHPHRGTWLIWGVLGVVVCVSQRADGAYVEPGHDRGAERGEPAPDRPRRPPGTGGMSAAEAVLIAVAGVGVAGWLLVDEPLVAVGCVVAADLIAAGMMLPKTWRSPDSETLSTFALGSLAGALALGSVGGLEPALLLYPLYYCLVNGALALLIRHRRTMSAGTGQVAIAL